MQSCDESGRFGVIYNLRNANHQHEAGPNQPTHREQQHPHNNPNNPRSSIRHGFRIGGATHASAVNPLRDL